MSGDLAVLPSFEDFQKQIPSESLFDGKSWKSSPKPLILSEKHHQILERLGPLLTTFVRACNLLYRQSVEGKRPAWIAQWMDHGKPEKLIQMSRASRWKNEIPQVIRPDLVLTEEGFALCEIDSIPGGIGMTAWLQETYSKFGFSIQGGDFGMRVGFQSIFPEGDVLISEEAADYRPEFEWLLGADRVKSAELGLSPSSSIYRFFEAFDWERISGWEEWMEKGSRMTPPLKPFLEEKIWLALLGMRPLRDFWRRELGDKGLALLLSVVPESWVLDPTPLPPHAVLPGLGIQDWQEMKQMSQKERELVMKVSGFSPSAWGSRGVWIGSDLSTEEWGKVVEEGLQKFEESPRILQRFVKGASLSHPFWNGEGEVIEMKGRARISPYYFVTGDQTVLGGTLATICPPDKKKIHGMKEAILVPVAAI
ncbi:MAG: hypothetical protein V4507_01550 [Verrucomicrobiota bacterium]